MTTKALYLAAAGELVPTGRELVFTAASSDICTSAAHGLDTGAGPFKVMNNAADAPSGLTVALPSRSFVTGTSVIATDVMVVGTTTYTVIATPADAYDVDLGTVDAETMNNIAAAINGDGVAAASNYDLDTPPHPDARAYVTGIGVNGAAAVMVVEARSLDATVGDAILLSSVDSTIVADNANLENGADGTDYWIIKLDDNTFSLATTKALAEAGTAVDIADAGTGITKLVWTNSTDADHMEEVVTNYITNPAGRGAPQSWNLQRLWQAMIDGMGKAIS